MKVNHLMTSQPHIIDENMTIFEAAQKMQLLGCGIFPIGSSDNIFGVITDRDIINRVISKRLDYEKTQVRDVMTQSIIFCYEHDVIPRAISLMNQNRIRRILVVNEIHQLVGILSMIDIFKRLKDKSLLSHLFVDSIA